VEAWQLYRRFHADKADERRGLFRGLVERYGVATALYPGSFVHVTPSFVIPEVVYADADRRAARFFADPELLEEVRRRCDYQGEATIRFHAGDYTKGLPEVEGYFDLLISQYGGFVSRHCARYLRAGGLLVANNSHGDASMAALDPGYELVAVCRRYGERFMFSDGDLETYLIPKKGSPPSRQELERTMRGPAFTRRVADYVFRRR